MTGRPPFVPGAESIEPQDVFLGSGSRATARLVRLWDQSRDIGALIRPEPDPDRRRRALEQACAVLNRYCQTGDAAQAEAALATLRAELLCHQSGYRRARLRQILGEIGWTLAVAMMLVGTYHVMRSLGFVPKGGGGFLRNEVQNFTGATGYGTLGFALTAFIALHFQAHRSAVSDLVTTLNNGAAALPLALRHGALVFAVLLSQYIGVNVFQLPLGGAGFFAEPPRAVALGLLLGLVEASVLRRILS